MARFVLWLGSSKSLLISWWYKFHPWTIIIVIFLERNFASKSNISNQQLNRLQLILNSAARAVTKTPKFHHITPHLKSLHWLKITQRIQYKILSLTYKSLQYNKPSSISDLLTIQPTRSTRSSAVVTLQRPSNPSRLKISDRSFYFQAPALWNALPHHLRSHSHSSESHSLLSLSSSQFHKQLKTHLFLHSYPP